MTKLDGWEGPTNSLLPPWIRSYPGRKIMKQGRHCCHHSCLNCIFRRAEIPHQVINNSTACFEKTLVGDFPGGPVVKNVPAKTGDTSSITGPGRSHMLWAAKPMMPAFPRAHTPQQEKPHLAQLEKRPHTAMKTHCSQNLKQTNKQTSSWSWSSSREVFRSWVGSQRQESLGCLYFLFWKAPYGKKAK